MPSCVLRYCINNSRNIGKSQGVTFHQFPRPGHKQRDSWIKFVQKNRSEETWMPSSHSRICSVHFKEDDKHFTKTGRVYIKHFGAPCEDENLASTGAIPPGNSLGTSRTIVDVGYRIPNAPGTFQDPGIPESKELIARVYRYLKTEYEQLKEFTGNSCDLSPLANILKRTADAAGVCELTVARILDEEKKQPSEDEEEADDAAAKRQKQDHSDDDDDVSQEEHELMEQQEEEQQQMRHNFVLETLKIEYEEEDESDAGQSSNPPPQRPQETETNSAVHHLICSTSQASVKKNVDPLESAPSLIQGPSHSAFVTIKAEPHDPDYSDSEAESSFHHVTTNTTHVTVKLEPEDEIEDAPSDVTHGYTTSDVTRHDVARVNKASDVIRGNKTSDVSRKRKSRPPRD